MKVILWPGTHAQTTLMMRHGCVISVPLVEFGGPESHEMEDAPAVYRKELKKQEVYRVVPEHSR